MVSHSSGLRQHALCVAVGLILGALIPLPRSQRQLNGETMVVGVTGLPRHDPQELRQRLQLPLPRERTVMVAFGGLGLSLDPALLARWPEHHFLVSEVALATAANATLIPSDLRPLELLPLCGASLPPGRADHPPPSSGSRGRGRPPGSRSGWRRSP